MNTKRAKLKYRKFFNIAMLILGGLILAIQPLMTLTESGASAASELPSLTKTAVLSAPNGAVNPHGKAIYSEYPSGKRELEVEIEDANAANGTSLSVFLNNAAIGQIVLNLQKGKLKLSTELGQTVPVVADGQTVSVKNGQTLLVSGAFSASATPTPTVSPTATPTGSPTATPTVSPTVTPSPANEIQTYANLTGATINGVLPRGFAQYEIHSSRTEIEVRVRQINLPNGTTLGVLIDNVNVGNIILQNGEGSLRLRSDKGQTVPVVSNGSTIIIQNGSATVLSGTFGSTINPNPSPTPLQGRYFEAHLTGSQLTPAVTTNGFGEVKIVLNAAETQATVSGEYSNLSSAQTGGTIEIRVGTAVIFYTLPTRGGTRGEFAPATVGITSAQVAQLRSGIFFAVINSANNPGGEIGGRLISHSERGDFDGDGINDLSVFRPSNGAWYARNSLGVSVQSLGGADDKIVSADYDGDGKTDTAVFRNVNGQATWQIVRSSDGGTTRQNWGLSTDQPVRGDFDGDGRTDLAVYRPSSGVWYIQNSDNSGYNFVSFGSSTDIPFAADMNGDGRDDIVVYRPSTGNWYILRSSDHGFQAESFGTAGDIPVAAQ